MPKKNAPVLKKEPEELSPIEVMDEIEEIEETEEVSEVEPKPARIQRPKEKYFEVYFLDKREESELDYHYLAVNGEALQVTKGSTVIIPQRFLVVADNATIVQHKKDGRKVEVSRCPYQIKREATEKEYLDMKREGTKKHLEDLEKKSRAKEKPVGS